MSTQPRKPSHNDKGFTLVEVLAALAIFSVAAIGIMRVTTENASAVQRIETRALARIVADNHLSETLIDQRKLSKGETTGVIEMAGRKWRWSQIIADTPNPLVLQITVSAAEINENERPSETRKRRIDAEVTAFDSAS